MACLRGQYTAIRRIDASTSCVNITTAGVSGRRYIPASARRELRRSRCFLRKPALIIGFRAAVALANVAWLLLR
jgi:hypothetical protein